MASWTDIEVAAKSMAESTADLLLSRLCASEEFPALLRLIQRDQEWYVSAICQAPNTLASEQSKMKLEYAAGGLAALRNLATALQASANPPPVSESEQNAN